MSRDRLNEIRTIGRPDDRGYGGGSYEMSQQSRVQPRRGGGGDFYAEVEDVEQTIEAVYRNIGQIERLHNRALVGVSQDEIRRINRDLDAMQNETGDLLNDARGRLTRLSSQTKSMGGSEANSRKAQQSNLARKVMDAASAYQNVQTKYKEKYCQRMEREIRIARPDATRDEVERALDSHSGPIFSQQLLSSRIGDQRRALQEMQSRHEEITKMEQSIEELAQLFQDMQILLEQQQEMIDTIETHVDDAGAHLEEGRKEINRAVDIRKSSRKKLWWIVLLVIILVIIIGVVAYIYVIAPIINASKAVASPTPNAKIAIMN